MQNHSYEKLGGSIEIQVSPAHTFGTDSFLLSHFAAPKRRDKAVDLCTGCGIVPFLWMREEAASPSEVWAVDVQPPAIEQVTDSVARSGLGGRFHPVLVDLREIRDHFPVGTMDLVTCNPPYKAEGTGLISEADSARIARHETLCTLDDVCAAAAWLLRFGGRFCLCQLPERLVDVLTAMRQNGLEPKRVRFVQQHSHSAPWLVLVEGKRGAKPFLQIDPPLILREGGKTSPEMERIYGMYGYIEDGNANET